ncbi:unnamed protein product [Chironomus riparius]|uniref:Dynein regulatory complex protein 9 n=1 Tax=Chironomus riparius TaxID=315576 RepID=A0A9N9RJ11_9DIPT|nr:unnamed protein product [Chironomus riparius]
MELSKLQVKLSPEFFKILDELIIKIKIISSLPLDPNECDEEDPNLDCPVIHPTMFKPCKDKTVQAFLGKQMIKEKCDEVCEVLENLRRELNETGTFKTLIDYVDDFCKQYLKDLAIFEEYDENVKALNKVKKDMIQFKKATVQRKRELDNEVYKTTLSYYKTQQDALVDIKLTSNWIDARVRQKELMESIKLEKINKSAENFEFMAIKEQSCGNAIESFYEYKIKELYDEASRISALYDKKMEELELRFQIAKNERRESEVMADNEKKLFESRQKQIDDYLAHKAKVAADKKLRELQEVKSITIQAWWRGVMVRCYLGSFKKFKKRARKIRQEMRAAKSQKSKNKKK